MLNWVQTCWCGDQRRTQERSVLMLAIIRVAAGEFPNAPNATLDAYKVFEILLEHGADVTQGEDRQTKCTGALSLAVQMHQECAVAGEWIAVDALHHVIKAILAAPGGPELANRRVGGVHGKITGWQTCLEFAMRGHNWDVCDLLKPYTSDEALVRECEEQRARDKAAAGAPGREGLTAEIRLRLAALQAGYSADAAAALRDKTAAGAGLGGA